MRPDSSDNDAAEAPPHDARIDVSPAQRLVALAMGLCFGGIGLAVLFHVWTQPYTGFGSLPLFFRVFASCIAIPFVVIGGTMAWAGLTGQPMNQTAARVRGAASSSIAKLRHPAGPPRAGGYVCPNCSAPLGDKVDVSPSGDVKCPYCRTWFNIHRRA